MKFVEILKVLLLYVKNYCIKVLKQFEMTKISYQWRLNNKHNKTIVANPISQELFPLDKVSVGKYTYGALHVIPYNKTDGKLNIGSFCSIAKDVKFLLGGNHDYSMISTYPFKLYTEWNGTTYSKGNIIIEDDVWICENVLVLSGVRIGQGAVIAANTVVSRDVQPYEIVGGNPMRHIKYRFSENVINKLVTIDFDTIDIRYVNRHRDYFTMHINDSNIEELMNLFNNRHTMSF